VQINRREILQAAGAWGVLHALPARGWFEATGMRLGLVTYQWGKDWDLPTLLQHCAETGFSGVELRTTHKHGVEISLTPAQRREVRARFADSPVEFVGPGTACEYHAADPAVLRRNIEETKAFIQLSADCGGSGVKVRPNGFPPGVPMEKTLQQIGESLREVGKFAAEHGQVIRLEVHGRGTEEPRHIRTMLDIADQPQVLVCWNCNPTDLQPPGLAANFELLQHRLGTIHIHDLRQTNYPWVELFALLKGANFTGWTLLEEGQIPADLPAALRENRTIWEQLTRR
jgi:sugar phosphate isomerase/epimerase